MHSAAIQRMRTIHLPKSSSNVPGPPSSYSGSGMSLHPHSTVPPSNPHSSVHVLEKLREVKLPKRGVEEESDYEDEGSERDSDEQSNEAEEEKKVDVSPTRPYNPDKPEIYLLNANTMSENKVPLDMRLVMGLPSKESIIARRSLSPPSSRPSSQEPSRPTSKEVSERRIGLGVVLETTREVPHTHSQLMAQLKKKHEFSEMLENVVPSDINREKEKSDKRGRRREREKRRRRRENSTSGSPGGRSSGRRSISPSAPVGLTTELEASSYASSILGRAGTAKRGKRLKEARSQHDPSALSLHEDVGHVYALDNYSSGDDFEGSGEFYELSGGSYHSDVENSVEKDVEKIMKRPWSEEDRAKRKGGSVSPKRQKQMMGQGPHDGENGSKKMYDKFQRPVENARWDYDEYGYLWADDEAFQHEKDRGALEKKKRFGKNKVEGERYKGLVEAYGDSVVPRAQKKKRRKGQKAPQHRPDDFAGPAPSGGNNNNFAFAPQEMGPTGGSTTLPPILPSDASRSVFSQSLPMNNYRLRTKQKGVTSYDSQFESLDIQHSVVQHHVYDLKYEESQQRHKENAIQLGIVWEIEKMKAALPMAFLQQWGLGGELAVNKSIKIIIRVINRIRHSTIWVWFKRWKSEIDVQIEIEFNAKMLLFQQGDALKTFEAIGRRCLRYAALSGLRQWKKQIEKWKFQEELGEMDAAARVIQKYITGRQAEQQSMNSMRAVVEVALHNRRQITMFLKFENQTTALVEHHKLNLTTKKKEDNAAAVIRRSWLASKSRGAIDRLILLTKDRKALERLALENKMARFMQRCWRARKDRMGLWQFRLARRKRIEQERKQAELKALEARMGLQVQRMRSSMAAVIQKNYRTHLFIMRFNKKAYERKKAKLARQLLEHQQAKIIQKNYRTYRFLMIFNQKAHQRKLMWMKEAEEKAKREYDAACFLQDCYKRSHSRHLMTMRFADRKNMLKQAQILLEQNKAALVIQMAYNHFKGRENLQMKIMKRKLAEEEEKRQRLRLAQKKAIFKQRTKAVKIIQRNFRTYRFLVTFNSKAKERKERWLEQQLLEHNSACVIQKNFRTYRFLTTFNSKAYERKQRWLEQQLLEHNSCCIIQKNFRTYIFLMRFNQKAHDRKKRWMKEAEAAAKAAHEKFLGEQATKIQQFCVAAFERYNQPVRILARRQLEIKRRKLREEEQARQEDAAARVVQHAWRAKGERDMLMGRFTKRRALMEKKGNEMMRNDKATVIAFWWLRILDRKALRRRVVQRQKLHEKIADHRMRDQKARILQRNYRLSRARFVQSLKFEQMRKRLAAERLLEEQTALAELAARRAAEARLAAEEALKQMVHQGWKLGSDPVGRNYWYNWVTGESTWTKPEGWKIKQDEIWVKNQDSKGNVYYFNQLTMETKWMPPCNICNKEMGKRICATCDFCVYCVSCYENEHEKMAGGTDHVWKAADIDKEKLKSGERYCVKCNVSAAKKACKICRDAYCDKCFRDIHSVGRLAKHPWVTWEDFKKGWQEVKGRVDGEKDYYFNATTMESSFEKPEELMLDEELAEHRLHMQYKKENEKNLKRIEKLAEKVAQYQYEKDQLWFEANMKKTADKEELEMLRQQLEAQAAQKKDRWKKMFLHPIKFYKDWQVEKKRAQQAYRRKLLLSAKQRRQIGMDDAPAAKG